MPYRDDFDAIFDFLNPLPNLTLPQQFLHLFSQNNEHRILLDNLVSLSMVSLTRKFNFVWMIASGVSTSIAQIISILRRMSKRNLRIVTQADVKSAQYQRVVQFKSELGPTTSSGSQTNLIEGIAELILSIKQNKVSLINHPQ